MSCVDIDEFGDVQIGNQQKMRAEYRDGVTGLLEDPTAIFVTVTSPATGPVTYQWGVDFQLVKEDVGIYYVLIDADVAGEWFVQFWSTGDVKANREISFTVTPLRGTQ